MGFDETIKAATRAADDVFVDAATAETEVVDDEGSTSNLPSLHRPLDALLAERDYVVRELSLIASVIKDKPSVSYFLQAYTASNRDRGASSIDTSVIFNLESAVAALDAQCWARAMKLTDVLDLMPAAKRNEWNSNIYAHKVPAFEKDMVYDTVKDLLLGREKFFAEKVDGMFQALSRAHVTNCPEGFSKRMIISHLYDNLGYLSYQKVAYIHDLRAVVARIFGREAPEERTTSQVFRSIRQDGQWNYWDGGAMKIRCYKVGTAHFEVHPEVAWRLNKILAMLYPTAIPSKFRSKPAKAPKQFALREDLITGQVLAVLAGLRISRTPEGHEVLRDEAGKPVPEWAIHLTSIQNWRSEIRDILVMIGGVESTKGRFVFAFPPDEVINEVLRTGSVPDRQSHQFFPTPETLAQEAIDMADIGPDDTCLEPSAGTGAIARLLPAERTTCVEISQLHATVLKSHGIPKVVRGDFLAWRPVETFTRVVMNPPFSEGRADAHVLHALELLAPGGKLVAILPPTSKSRLAIDLPHIWSEVKHKLFADTSVSVIVLTVDKPV